MGCPEPARKPGKFARTIGQTDPVERYRRRKTGMNAGTHCR